ncbi:MAG: hypothetical protein ABI912_01280, partial [Actinomycetota bacterium]
VTVPSGLTGVKAIAAGYLHSLALKNDGTVVGWGANGYGEATPPAGLRDVVAIAAEGSRSVALKSDGTVVTWGKGAAPRGATRGLTGVSQIAASSTHVLAITSSDTPSAPTGVSVRLRGSTARVTWSAPVHRGISGLSRYVIRAAGFRDVAVPAGQLSYDLPGVPAGGVTVSVSAESGSARGLGTYRRAARADVRMFDPATRRWLARAGAPVTFGAVGDLPVPGDYDGDGIADIAVYRPHDSTWHVRGWASPIRFGRPGDIPVPADYNGDGQVDLAVFRPSDGVWYIRGIGTVRLGAAGDIPLPGDYDGLGHADVMVYRPSNGVWYRTVPPRGSSTDHGVQGGVSSPRRYGTRGDIPVPGDWNGDGVVEIGVFRPSTGTWYGPRHAPVHLGRKGDVPLADDFNVDGVEDIGVFRPSNATWYLSGIGAVAFGKTGNVPLVVRPGGVPLSW